MIRSPISRGRKLALNALAVLAMVGSYTWLSHRQHQENPNDTTIPSWSQMWEGTKKAVEVNPREEARWIVMDAEATAGRLFLGLLSGVAGAVLIGLLMGISKSVEAFFAPPLSLLAKIPPTAALAVFFVMVGTDLEMYVAMIAFGVLPTMAQVVQIGVNDVRDELIHKAYTLGASTSEIVWNVIVRQVLPHMIDAVRLQIGPALVYLIAAEMVCAGEGFGYRIRLQFKLLNMNVVYPYLAALAMAGYALDWSLTGLRRRLAPWYQGGAS